MNMLDKNLLHSAVSRSYQAPAVQVTGLRKSYGSAETRTDALLGIDFEVGRAEIVGVLGPNGAGKTTLVSILEGLVEADAGSAHVLGADLGNKAGLSGVKQLIGVAMQNSVLPPLVSALELLQFLRALYDQGRDPRELINVLGLDNKCDAQMRFLSGGQQQRVAVALALIGDPELMFLDEPTSQLDPQARRVVWDLLLQQRERKRAAILVTTHQMEEAERLCDRVVILDQGRILAQGTPRALIEAYCPERCVEFFTLASSDLAFLGERTSLRECADGQVEVKVRPRELNPLMLDLLTRQGRGELVANDLRVGGQTLEDVFLKITGREIR